MYIAKVLSFPGSLKVIPLMAFATAYLGEKLRKISKDANLSIAALSAYLNEVHLCSLPNRRIEGIVPIMPQLGYLKSYKPVQHLL